MTKTVLHELSDFGQSIWLDNINRSMLRTGQLKRWIEQGLRGMTSNPTIFHQAITQGNDYDEDIGRLRKGCESTFGIYDRLTIQDIQQAADLFRSVYDQSGQEDGYVSLEINPQLAKTVSEQAEEGKRLFAKVNRPNVMIKVPSTSQGFPVIEELVANGINVNVTLIFSLARYEQSVAAYLAGLKRRLKEGKPIQSVRSVASVFVSRIDTVVDQRLEALTNKTGNARQKERLLGLRGQAAVANCQLIFARFQAVSKSPAFKDIAQSGGRVQRVLWGSTSTKNPQYPDIKYVTQLMARPTVNTIPDKTLIALLDHGRVREAFGGAGWTPAGADQVVRELKGLGIDVDNVCADLLEAGVDAFVKSFDGLLEGIEQKAAALATSA